MIIISPKNRLVLVSGYFISLLIQLSQDQHEMREEGKKQRRNDADGIFFIKMRLVQTQTQIHRTTYAYILQKTLLVRVRRFSLFAT
jgi:hypothetical protein